MRSSNHTKIHRIRWHKNHASADNEELPIINKTPHFLSSEGNILISPTVSQQSQLIVVKCCTNLGWIWRTRHCGSCLRWLIWWYRCWWIWLLDFILSFTCGVIQNFVSVSMSCGSLGNKPKRIQWRSFLPSVAGGDPALLQMWSMCRSHRTPCGRLVRYMTGPQALGHCTFNPLGTLWKVTKLIYFGDNAASSTLLDSLQHQ